MTDQDRPQTSVTGRRLLAGFAAILALFAAALAVELFTLNRIAGAERLVARLDHAKHAGHTAAAQVREQYIHQAHTLIEFGTGHVAHYVEVVEATRRAMAHLRAVADTDQDRVLVAEIARLAEANDRDFRDHVIPAIERGDRRDVAALGGGLEAVVDRVVDLNAELNAGLETRAETARRQADHLRHQAVIATIVCFALAIAFAAGVGLWLARAIVRRVDLLRQGVRRVGAGELGVRIELDGNDEFAELAGSFNLMAASLAREQAALVRSHKLASIGQVAAGVAHELNNPLSVIIGYTKLLRAEAGASADELRIIDDEARQCQRIVRELLDLAAPHRLEIQAVELGELAREAVERLRDSGALADRKVAFSAGAPVVVAADAGRLRQVIANVVINASEATTASGTIEIATSTDAGAGVLTIADDGTGIAPEFLPQVFDPFVTTKRGGTGLGLAIAHAIVDAHGGRIVIASSPDRGTRVSVRLPMAAGAAS